VPAAISDELRRFLLTGSVSVPHVEAILQLRQRAPEAWDAERLGARIYVPTSRARNLLADLLAIGIVKAQDEDTYTYSPATSELAMLLDQLAKANSEQLVTVTQLIHTAEERKAQGFAAAFRFRKDS
jgi:DNA-binding IclR family transcriptional regulator